MCALVYFDSVVGLLLVRFLVYFELLHFCFFQKLKQLRALSAIPQTILAIFKGNLISRPSEALVGHHTHRWLHGDKTPETPFQI